MRFCHTGGCTSENRTFTVLNGVPMLTAVSPNTTAATGSAFDAILTGEDFVTTSRVLYNGTLLAQQMLPLSVRPEVYDTFSRKVATVVDNKAQAAGTYQTMWDGSALSTGVYTVVTKAVTSTNFYQSSIQITVMK
jgi:hypothetical protein